MTRAVLAGVLGVALLSVVACSNDAAPVADTAAVDQAREFLDRYVDADGRVVRHDQGGDTVSEGQAYALLLATAAGDHDRVTSVWRWSVDNLRREDGLLSWRWADGGVRDPNSATDADLDAARALVLAGDRFADPDLTAAGKALATAVLDHATVVVGEDRVLVAGNWARTAPYPVNPSYLSPVATAQLRAATGDPRWDQVSRTASAQVAEILDAQALPPDWARVDDTGRITAAASPDGTPPRFGLDAARTVLRFEESCVDTDRALAGRTAVDLALPPQDTRAVYDLAGSPQVDWQHPLGMAAAAAAADASGDRDRADDLLDAAARLDDRAPTYYGSAWAALGRVLLRTTLLNDCARTTP